MRSGRLVVAALLGLAAGCSGSTAGPPTGSAPTGRPATTANVAARTAGPCGWGSAPKVYDHVVWVVLENRSYGELVGPPGSRAAGRSPYLNELVARCGVATNSWSLTHPSLPNYLAMVSGSTGGVTTDCSPAACPQRRRTLFDQVRAAGGTWRVLAESMPKACARGNAGRYVARHNPPTYFPALRPACRRWDRPMGTSSAGRLVDMVREGRLPSLLLVVPNQCHNTHDCAIRYGDRWLSRVVPLITGGPDYRAGRTAIVVTWDEGAGGSRGQRCAGTRSSSCRIVTAVVAPSVSPGTRADARLDHYALLAATEDMLGIAGRLRHAGDARTGDLRSAFGL